MLRQVDHHVYGEMTPLATINGFTNAPYWKEFQFAPDIDEWGSRRIAAFEADEIGLFAVVHYEHEPFDAAHLFVLDELPAARIADFIEKVAAALELPSGAFQWRSPDGEMMSLAPREAV